MCVVRLTSGQLTLTTSTEAHNRKTLDFVSKNEATRIDLSTSNLTVVNPVSMMSSTTGKFCCNKKSSNNFSMRTIFYEKTCHIHVLNGRKVVDARNLVKDSSPMSVVMSSAMRSMRYLTMPPEMTRLLMDSRKWPGKQKLSLGKPWQSSAIC